MAVATAKRVAVPGSKPCCSLKRFKSAGQLKQNSLLTTIKEAVDRDNLFLRAWRNSWQTPHLSSIVRAEVKRFLFLGLLWEGHVCLVEVCIWKKEAVI